MPKIEEKMVNAVEKQITGSNGAKLTLAVIMVGGLIWGLKTIAEVFLPHLGSNEPQPQIIDDDSVVDYEDYDEDNTDSQE